MLSVVQWRRGKLCAVVQPGGLHHSSGRGGADGSPWLRLLLPDPRGQVGVLTDPSACAVVTVWVLSALHFDPQDCDFHVGLEVLPPDWRRVPVQHLQQLSARDAAPGNNVSALSTSTSNKSSDQCKLFPLKHLVALFFWAVNVPPWLCRNDAECVQCWWGWSSRPPTVIRW